jgi:hypothetical protein
MPSDEYAILPLALTATNLSLPQTIALILAVPNGLFAFVHIPLLLGVGVGVGVVPGVVLGLLPPPVEPLEQAITANVNANVRMSENASVVVFKNLARKIWGGGVH